MLFFLLKKNLDFYATMCHIWINGTDFTYTYQTFLDEADKSILFQRTTNVLISERYFDKRSNLYWLCPGQNLTHKVNG